MRALAWHDLPAAGPYSLDGRMWSVGATELMARGEAIDVPLMIGWNDFDGSSLRLPAEQVVNDTPADVLATYDSKPSDIQALAYAIWTDKHVGAPARWVAHKLQSGAPTYLYVFSHVPWVFRGRIPGAEHGMEFPYAFNTWDAELPPVIGRLFVDDDDAIMTHTMHQCWVSFVKQGVPDCPNAPEWPRYQRAEDQLMELKVNREVRSRFRARQLDAHENALQFYLNRTSQKLESFVGKGLLPTGKTSMSTRQSTEY